MEKASPEEVRDPDAVILAAGDYPAHHMPLRALNGSAPVVCCDGAAREAMRRGIAPAAVVGDGDSLPATLRASLGARWIHDPGQDDNDLSKAFRYCVSQGWRRLTIVGATGLREDHALANISLLADFSLESDVVMLTDHGIFTAHRQGMTLPSARGQQVSIFSFDPAMPLSSDGLKYPLRGLRLTRWWQATLNEALGDSFTLTFAGGPVLVFRVWTE